MPDVVSSTASQPATSVRDADVVRVRRQLGTLVREARQHRGWTQRQLAETAATSQGAIWALESGIRPASLSLYCRVLAVLGCQLTAELEALDADIEALRQRTAHLSAAERFSETLPWDGAVPLAWLSTADGWAVAGDVALGVHGLVRPTDALELVLDENGAAWPLLRSLWVAGTYRPSGIREPIMPADDESLRHALSRNEGRTWVGRWSPMRIRSVDEAALRTIVRVPHDDGPLFLFPGEWRPQGFPFEGRFEVPVLGVAALAALSARRRRSLRVLTGRQGAVAAARLAEHDRTLDS